jgi:hypothetical protein
LAGNFIDPQSSAAHSPTRCKMSYLRRPLRAPNTALKQYHDYGKARATNPDGRAEVLQPTAIPAIGFAGNLMSLKRGVSVELRARASLNPFDQAATAFCDALGILLGIPLGSIGFFPGTTHIGVVELHSLRHHSPLSDDASIAALPDKTR